MTTGPRDERQFHAELEVHTPDWAPGAKLAIGFKRLWDRQADQYAHSTADAAGLSEEEVQSRLSESGPIANVYITAGQKSSRSGDPYLNDVLSRLVAAALLDSAKIDSVAYIVDRLVKLEPVHIRIVELFVELAVSGISAEMLEREKTDDPHKVAASKLMWRDGGSASGVEPETIGTPLGLDIGIVMSCFQELAAIGFMRESQDGFRFSFEMTTLGLAASKLICETRDELQERLHRNS